MKQYQSRSELDYKICRKLWQELLPLYQLLYDILSQNGRSVDWSILKSIVLSNAYSSRKYLVLWPGEGDFAGMPADCIVYLINRIRRSNDLPQDKQACLHPRFLSVENGKVFVGERTFVKIKREFFSNPFVEELFNFRCLSN